MRTSKSSFTATPLPPDRRSGRGIFARAVGSFVPKLAAKAFEKYGFHSAEIMTAWPRVVGADIAEYTAPERIKWPRGFVDGDGTGASEGATLVVRVDPARALDIAYRSAEIVDRINRYFGYRAIATLRVVQAPLQNKSVPAVEIAATQSQAAEPAPIPPSAEPELANALRALWASVSVARQRP